MNRCPLKTALPCLSAWAVVTLLALPALGQMPPGWKVFVSRAGWSISYPSDWRIGNCMGCKDPKQPGVDVDFFPPKKRTAHGWVLVEPLADKPSDTNTDAWLAEVSTYNNLNPHIHEEKLKLNDQPALKVRYRAVSGEEMEAVYVVAGSKTFTLNFGGDFSGGEQGVPLEKVGNYPTYLKMLDTFLVKPPQ